MGIEKKELLGKRTRNRFRNYFLTGLLVTVPLGITFLVLKFLISLADGVLKIIPAQLRDAYPLLKIPGLGMLLTLSLVLIAGFLAHNFIGKKLVAFGERIIQKIPLVRSVYSASKQLLETVFAGREDNFERVVLIEYPRKGILSIGFVTGMAKQYSLDILPEPHVNIFIPTTPNPTSGWYILLPEKDIILLDISVEEAFKIIISAGMVMPRNGIHLVKP